MATNEEILSPKVLILPSTIPSTQKSPPIGMIVLSGAMLVFYNGTDWKYVLGV